MEKISLIVNIVVLVPVLVGLLSNSPGMADAFGPDAAARRILVAVYLAIAGLSAVLMVWGGGAALIPGLLVVQVVYKLLTVPLLGIGHPVVMANLGVVAVHAVTLWTLAR
ncbi:hypothetical protein [Jannaschia pohangensis]|uniref:DoxX-like family protein n=1 Tax=Jannaschia pohangensis TaxID=390807 RepID=A0A1I3N3N9_9RHOB|nr:hypothetical protein [Jannaschia pohangensis]SFJ03974.1 hypothetical protein SAMN04488095_2046 [Jannaschia pohangensis]